MRKVSLRQCPVSISPSHSTLLVRLKGSKFDNKVDFKALAESFDSGMKTAFSDNTKLQYIKFGGPRDNDKGHGVKDGKLGIPG
jgi:hypothetical protein